MALRKIRTEEDPVLKKVSKPVVSFDAKLHLLLGDMKDTLIKADGVGLAAVQIGILRRVVLIDVGDEHGFIEAINGNFIESVFIAPIYDDDGEIDDILTVNINGEIIEKRGEQREIEGCLSLPEKSGITSRPMYVKFKAQDRYGNWFEAEGEGLFARCVCHEFDHLDGHVFTERLAPGERVRMD